MIIAGGASQTVRHSIEIKQSQRPVPGGGRPRPPARRNVEQLPRVRALYDYQAGDVDELSFTVGQEFQLIKESKKVKYKTFFFVSKC